MSCELYEQKIVTAKIEHRCECCGRKIKPGEKYSYEKWKNDYFYTCKLCVPCYCAVQFCLGDALIDPEEYSYQEVHDCLHDEFCCKCQKRADDSCEIDEDVFDCPIIAKRLCDIEGIKYEQ